MYNGLTYEDAKALFTGNIVRYKGVPAFVHDVKQLFIYTIQVLGDTEPRVLKNAHNDFSTDNLPDGFANMERGVVVFTRTSKRQWGYGFTHKNVSYCSLCAYAPALCLGAVFCDNPWIKPEQGLLDMFNGTYPSFAEAVKLVRKKEAVAFARRMAITNKGEVVYDKHIVATVKKNVTNPAFIEWNPKYEFLSALIGGDNDHCFV